MLRLRCREGFLVIHNTSVSGKEDKKGGFGSIETGLGEVKRMSLEETDRFSWFIEGGILRGRCLGEFLEQNQECHSVRCPKHLPVRCSTTPGGWSSISNREMDEL